MEITSKMDPNLNTVALQVLDYVRLQNDVGIFPIRADIREHFKDIPLKYVNCVIGRLLHKHYIRVKGSRRLYKFVITLYGISFLEAKAKAATKEELIKLVVGKW